MSQIDIVVYVTQSLLEMKIHWFWNVDILIVKSALKDTWTTKYQSVKSKMDFVVLIQNAVREAHKFHHFYFNII